MLLNIDMLGATRTAAPSSAQRIGPSHACHPSVAKPQIVFATCYAFMLGAMPTAESRSTVRDGKSRISAGLLETVVCMPTQTCIVVALHRHDGKRVQMLDVRFGASRLELFADMWHTIIAEVSVRSRHLGSWTARPRSEHKCRRGSLGSRRKAFGRLRDFVPLPVEELGERHQHDSNVDGREQGPLQKRLCVCGSAEILSHRQTPRRGAGVPAQSVRRRAVLCPASRTWCSPTRARRRS